MATEEELTAAIATATGDDRKDCLCFIEVVAHKDDTSKELLEWGSRVSAANSRPPNPQKHRRKEPEALQLKGSRETTN